MKFLLLAAFVVVCTASTLYRGKNISFNDDGSIVITSSSSGKRVIITKQIGYDGQKAIDVTVSGPYMPTKRIQIDEEKNLYETEIGGNKYPWSSVNSVEDEQMRGKRSFKKEKSQADVLFEILREYQGPVPEPLFEKLLVKIDKAVKKGEISRQIYDLLVELDQIDQPSNVFGNQVGLDEQTIVPERYTTWSTRMVPQIQGGRVVLVQEQVPVVQGIPYGQIWGTTRYVNPLLQRWLQGQILTRPQLNSGVWGGLQSQQNILDEILARKQLVGTTPLTFQQQQNIVDEILKRQQLTGGVPQQDIINEIMARQQPMGGVPLSLQSQQNIVDEILARQRLNGGVPLSLQTQQNIVDEVLAQQQLTGGVPLSLQTQQNIVDEVLAQQQLTGGVPLNFQTQQDIVDEILARQQRGGLQTNQNIVNDWLLGQQYNKRVSQDYQTGQNALDQILARQQLTGYQPRQNIVDQIFMRQQPMSEVSGRYQFGQNTIEEVLQQQQLENDIARTLQAEQQQLQQQRGLQNGQSLIGNLLRSQQMNSGMPVRSDSLLKEYLSGNQQVPYSQRQSFGTLLGMLRNRPVGYYQGVRGYQMKPVQPTIVQNGRGVYMDNMGVPQIVY